ncbi:MFS transporter [Leucobacter massiliensis]|uniref:Major facilitator superfamily (MFS) profile domain-containing protein n=1 Tax=Leucobacter massiliensis TaxID=1686285 RepID=A0A2S9QQ40_9MICO|nr:MFS transporter [Leucobacter massiliensis]PRI11709.1 hypothetical protein B4915_04495 [Leucobacter massiliensis]
MSVDPQSPGTRPAVSPSGAPDPAPGGAAAPGASDAASTRSLARFSVLWLGQFVSNVGSGLTAFGLAAYLFERTGAATSVTLVTLCAFLPPALLAPLAGVLADRFDRRLIMIAGDGLSMLGLAYILGVALAGDVAPWQIYLGVLCSSLFGSLLDPAYRATVTDLVPAEHYDRASGMVQLAASSKYLISPVLAGFLYPLLGIAGILVLDIATFAVTVATTLAVRRHLRRSSAAARQAPQPERAGRRRAERRGRELLRGWRELTAHPGVLTVVGIMALATFCVGFLETLFPPMMLSFSTPQTLGVVQTVAATGMIAGSLVLSTVTVTTRYVQELLIGLGIAGVCIAGIGITANPVVIAVAGFCFFASLPFVNTPAEVLIRSAIPNAAQGRAWGLISLLSNIGFVAAFASAGPLADRVFGPLLLPEGALAGSLGSILGTGPGRGIGLMIVLVGALLAVAALCLGGSRRLAAFTSADPGSRSRDGSGEDLADPAVDQRRLR